MNISQHLRKQFPNKEPPIRCKICGTTVAIETAKTDADGNAVHEKCHTPTVDSEHANRDKHPPVIRSWKMVAGEISREQDPNRMTELVSELNHAMDEQNLDGTPKLTRDGEPKPDK